MYSMFWSSEKLKKTMCTQNIFFPFNENNIVQGAYELSMGDTYYCTDIKSKKRIYHGEQFRIPPGQFALLETKEIINIPKNSIGLISIKGSIKLKGLVNVSGFHVDPGFNGKLVFSVYNAGGNHIHISNGELIFLIWLCDIGPEEEKGYTGNSNRGITDSMVSAIGQRLSSPPELHSRLTKLETQFKITIATLSIAVSLLTAYFTILISAK